jgi:hypothetical protein
MKSKLLEIKLLYRLQEKSQKRLKTREMQDVYQIFILLVGF